ncbi:hypothetical protein [Priestia megaterium]|uniref:hypothetical protein n=1 Tax=Priestia megaterium TaxID=1404 RepID=UPI00345A6522
MSELNKHELFFIKTAVVTLADQLDFDLVQHANEHISKEKTTEFLDELEKILNSDDEKFGEFITGIYGKLVKQIKEETE